MGELSQPEPETGKARVVVQVGWQDSLLHIASVRPGGSFRLGGGRGSFPVPAEALVERRQPLVVHRSGVPYLVIPAKARGSLTRRDGTTQSFEELRPAGTFRSVFSETIKIPLVPGAEAQLELGNLTVTVSRSTSAAIPPRLAAWTLDRRLAASLGGSAIAMILLLLCCRHLLPPLGGEEYWAQGPMTCITRTLFYEVGAAHVDGLEPPPHLTSDPGESPEGSNEACRCHQTQMGDRDVSNRNGHYGVGGPQDNPDPHISRYLGSIDFPGWFFIGWTAPMPSSRDSPTAPWGRDEALGQHRSSARAGMWGDAIRATRGEAGMGSRLRGGVAKQIVSTATDRASAGQPPRIFHADLRTAGPRPRQEILQVVAARFGRFSSCYTERPSRVTPRPGRLAVQFVIPIDGKVTDLHAAESTLADPELTACLIAAFDDLTFPATEIGPTRVRYPLFVQPGTEPDRSGDPTPSASQQRVARRGSERQGDRS